MHTLLKFKEEDIMKLYGTYICPDCKPAEDFLKEKSIDFQFINITESIENLKEFTKLRDSRAEFDEIKAGGYLGIPCMLTEDGRIFFQDDIYEEVFR